MSIGNGTIYIQFHPLVYILKLHIEMNIAELIVKVVRATSGSPYYASGTELHSSRKNRSNFPQNQQQAGGGGSQLRTGTNGQSVDPFSAGETGVTASVEAGEAYAKRGGGMPGTGITKIVQTRVTSRRRDEDADEDGSSESSTRNLQQHHGHPHSFG